LDKMLHKCASICTPSIRAEESKSAPVLQIIHSPQDKNIVSLYTLAPRLPLNNAANATPRRRRLGFAQKKSGKAN
jgi:hypothetical protein